MKRDLEPVDLMVAVGVFATLLGGYLFFMATSGPVGATTPEAVTVGRSPDIMEAMQWIQPALGQAIVDEYLLRRRASEEIAGAAMELHQAVLDASRLPASPFGGPQIMAWAAKGETDHAARVQFVLGRFIADATARGVRSGALSPADLSNDYNRRMISIAEATESRMQGEFWSRRQENLGQAIVTATQWHARLAERMQERVGHAVVAMARVQDGYREASNAIKAQTAAAALAGVRTEQQANLFARLASAEHARSGPAIPFVEPRAWVEIPTGFWFAASAVLIGVFFAGLLMPSGRHEPTIAKRTDTEESKTYRKTA